MLRDLGRLLRSVAGAPTPTLETFGQRIGLRFEEAERRVKKIEQPGAAFTRTRKGERKPPAEPPRFSLDEVAAAIATESYLRQAISKYVHLIFKEDYQFTAQDERAREYIRLRLALIARQTGVPTRQFLWEVAENLVKYHNVFIAKVRHRQALVPQGYRVQGLDGKPPVAGYFLLPPTTMRIAVKHNGEVVRYEQHVPGSDPLEFRPDDIIHIAYQREAGHQFGMPFWLQVIDDIRMLREVEYNVSRLLYLYLHPLYVMKVGKDEPGKEPTPEEMHLIQEMTRDMELGGILYLPGDRYDLDVKGAQGEALNADWALRYFERRVLGGMGVPETAFGRGDAVNRATADQLTAEMHDTARAYQQVISLYFEEFILRELLEEAGFDPLLRPQEQVRLVFSEIRLDEIIKKENHAVFKYEHNAITFDEMRREIGMDPLEPAEESGLHFWRIQIPRIQATAMARTGQVPEPPSGSKDTDNRNRPTNQHGTKISPGSKLRVASFDASQANPADLAARIDALMATASEDLNGLAASESAESVGWVLQAVHKKLHRLLFEPMFDQLLAGIERLREETRTQRRPELSIPQLAKHLEWRADAEMTAILDELAHALQDALGTGQGFEPALKRAAHRLRLLSRYYLSKSFWYGYAQASKALGRLELVIQASEASCGSCRQRNGVKLVLEGDLFSLVPAFHPGCQCGLTLEGAAVSEA